MPYETAKLLYGIIQMQCDKLTSIPQVLGIGFSAGIVPYMTIALENRDYEGSAEGMSGNVWIRCFILRFRSVLSCMCWRVRSIT